MQLLAEFGDAIQSDDVDCCVCDEDKDGEPDDVFFESISTDARDGSNCKFLVGMTFSEKINLSRKNNMCIFTLGKQDNEEVQWMRIVKVWGPKKKGKAAPLEEIYAEIPKYNVRFPMEESPSVKEYSMHLQFDTLRFEKIK